MIYDCFTFFNELDLLELRLGILDKFVDKFVISEATKTHSGEAKDLIFLRNRDRFKKFENKIVYINADEFPQFKNSWTYENYQRNALLKGLKDCSDNDIILISDLDEIPNLESMPRVLKDGVVYCFLQDMYFYYVNNYKNNQIVWEGGTKATTYKTIASGLLNEKYVKYNDISFPKINNQGVTLTKIRLYRNLSYIINGGWHLSYIGGVKAIQKKISAGGHQEFNNRHINSEEFIIACLAQGSDIFDPESKCYKYDINKLPNEFKGLLPSSFFLKDGKMQSRFMYILSKFKERTKIIVRNYIRKVIG